MAVVAMKQLLEAGVHFGHQTRRWDPKMAEYIFQARGGIHIIDLQKTSKKLDEAYKFVKDEAEEGKTVLFVGTKKQAQDCIKEAAERCNMYYINQRWLGGMLTNFETIRTRVQRLKDLERMQEDGTFEVLPKKEVQLLKKEMEKLDKNLSGIKNMEDIPGVLFVVDPKKERIAVLEAHKLGIPVVGLVDTNCNPYDVDYAIPGNDDAIRAVKLIADVIANAVIEGNQGEDAVVPTVVESEEEVTDIEEVVAEEPVEEVAPVAEEVAEEVAPEAEEVVEKKPAKRTSKKAEKAEEVVEEKAEEEKEEAPAEEEEKPKKTRARKTTKKEVEE